MRTECYPLSTLPGTSALFRDYAEARLNQPWYAGTPFGMDWVRSAPQLPEVQRQSLAGALEAQAETLGMGDLARRNVEALRGGAAAVVTGQQVGLLGGPLLTLLKAATAIRKAQDATEASGRQHVPVFWLASEDHDVAEVDQVHLLGKQQIVTLHGDLGVQGLAMPVGSLLVGGRLDSMLATAEELLGFAPVCEVLRAAYRDADGYRATLASGFGRFLSAVFADHGLVVMDAAGRAFHALGASVLRAAIEQAEVLETAVLARSAELEAAGYHAQVKVAPGMSLLFLLSEAAEGGGQQRQALRRTSEGLWKAGARQYSKEELLAVLEITPERLSPNALLRPVMQDAILPTAAYIGGPAEVAYFAQAAVLYKDLLGRVTPILPRLSATLVAPEVATVMAQQEIDLTQVWRTGSVEEMTVRFGARAMPVEEKQRLAAVGNAMDAELTALIGYMGALSADLGRAAGVSGNKMRYQMNRLRRLAARFEADRTGVMRKQATQVMLNLYPEQHLQERLLAGVVFLARFGEALPQILIEQAEQTCPGHRVLWM